jgi:hypothetical protein
MLLNATDELEAVNTMLAVIGEANVNTLDVIGNLDVSTAIATLRGVSREVQSRGLWFNSDDRYTFTLNAAGQAVPPDQILSIRPLHGRGSRSYTIRNGRVYSRGESTDVFTADNVPTARVVWFLPFDEIPETARRYIAVRAARIFQKNYLGSESLNGFSQDHEAEVLGLFQEEAFEHEYAEGANFLTDHTDVSSIAGIDG